MPLLSWTFAGEAVIASGKPYLSTAKWILMPLIFLPPSKPRPKQVGAERQERLSRMTALGSGVSPQACRQAWIKRLSSRRHSPSRVHRANSVYSVPNGMSHSWPMARHCRPQKQTHQIAMIALRSAAPVNGGFGPERVRRVPSAAMAASSDSTASTKASTLENASHEAGDVLAGLKAVPIGGWSGGCCDGRRHSPAPSRVSALILLKVASRSASAGTTRLRTVSELLTSSILLACSNTSQPPTPHGILCSLLHPRWEFVFQPKYAAYLNLIEPWWKVLRSLALKGRRFETWTEIEQAIERATAYWNAHKHPFVWGRRRRHRQARRLGVAALPAISLI